MEENIKVKINPTFHEVRVKEYMWEKENNSKYIEYRNKWENNPKNFIIEKAPIHLDIETSSLCNLRCPMCSCTIDKEKNNSYKTGLMAMDLYKKVIDEASEIGVYSIKLNWRGEPLIHPHIVEMVQYAKDKGIIDIMINTNAVTLDKDMSIGLIEAGLDHLFISFDSIIKERYEKYRVGANFEKVVKNIKEFCELNNKFGHKVETRIQKVLLNETNDEAEKFNQFFCKMVDKIAYEDYIPYGNKNYGNSIKKDKNIKFACCQLWQRLFVEWNGNYAMCCDSQNEEFILGNAYKQSIMEIWNSSQLQNVRELHKTGDWKEIPVCRKCFAPYM